MKEFTFKLNGVDYAARVNRHGYETDRTPVYAAQFTDLSGVDHDVILRWKGHLRVKLNPMRVEDAARLCGALMVSPLRVTYHSFQTGTDVTEEMRVTSMPQQFALKNYAGVRWNYENELEFEQK